MLSPIQTNVVQNPLSDPLPSAPPLSLLQESNAPLYPIITDTTDILEPPAQELAVKTDRIANAQSHDEDTDCEVVQGPIFVHLEPKFSLQSLKARVTLWEDTLDTRMPNIAIQTKFDEVESLIKQHLSCLTRFNDFLDSNGGCCWESKLANFLVKLPMRSARNIVQLLASIVHTSLYTTVHPLKTAAKMAKLTLDLIERLSHPEVLVKLIAKFGAGMVGASLGQALISGNPLSLLSLLIGSTMTLTGTLIDLELAAIDVLFAVVDDTSVTETKQKFCDLVCSYAHTLPETFLSGLFMGLLMGGFQKITQTRAAQSMLPHDPASAQKWMDKYIQTHNLPKPAYISYVSPEKVVAFWERSAMTDVLRAMPQWGLSASRYYAGGIHFNPAASHHVIELFENTALSGLGRPLLGLAAAKQS